MGCVASSARQRRRRRQLREQQQQRDVVGDCSPELVVANANVDEIVHPGLGALHVQQRLLKNTPPGAGDQPDGPLEARWAAEECVMWGAVNSNSHPATKGAHRASSPIGAPAKQRAGRHKQSLGSRFLSILIRARRRNGVRISSAGACPARLKCACDWPAEAKSGLASGACWRSNQVDVAQANNSSQKLLGEGVGRQRVASDSMHQVGAQQEQPQRARQTSIPTDLISPSYPNNNNNNNMQPANNEHGEAQLFTCINQLCHEIIEQRLLNATTKVIEGNNRRLLCLFVFGRPGSNKGELAYELVDHSPLVEFATSDRPLCACPLYHYIDVSALIAANIGQRAREYNQLVAQTLRTKRAQSSPLGSLQNSSGDGGEQTFFPDAVELMGDESKEPASGDELDQEDLGHSPSQLSSPLLNREPSILSELSEAPSTDSQAGRSAAFNLSASSMLAADQFSPAPLSTKQRSILQMRLLRHKSCVTMKWTLELIECEVSRLELAFWRRFKELSEATADELSLPNRVYLINFIPNQLSLFKPCLYLQQSFAFNEFRRPCWALKFERRTNIKLMVKERANVAESGSSPLGRGSPIAHCQPFIKLPSHKLIKFPALGGAHQSSTTTSKLDAQQQQQVVVGATEAANMLAGGVNEKLGPKFNETFAQQFQAAGKLTRLRFNPIRNYNYAQYLDYCSSFDSELGEAETQGEVSSRSLRSRSLSCQQQLEFARSLANGNLRTGEARAQSPGSLSSSSQTSHSFDSMLLSVPRYPGSPASRSSPTGSMNNLVSSESESPDPDPETSSGEPKSAPGKVFTFKLPPNCGTSPLEGQAARSMNDLRVIVGDQKSNLTPAISSSNVSGDSLASCASSSVGPDDLAVISPINRSPSNKLALQRLGLASGPAGRLAATNLIPKWAVELELIANNSSLLLTGKHLAEAQSNHPAPAGPESRWLRTPSPSSICPSLSGSSEPKRHSVDSTLVDSHHRLAALKVPASSNVTLGDGVLGVLYPPASSRPSSRSSLMFHPGAGERSKQAASAYFLVQTRVAYANGKNQRITELKRFHHRVIKYKSRSDMAKLLKLLSKAKLSLDQDLGSWLAAAIATHCNSDEALGGPRPGCDLLHSQNQHSSAKKQQPTLVTYTIRLDVTQLLREHGGGGGNEHQIAVGQPMGNVFVVPALANKRAMSRQAKQSPDILIQRPASSIGLAQTGASSLDSKDLQRPASSMAAQGRTMQAASGNQASGAQKHVRFCLYEAPNEINHFVGMEQGNTRALSASIHKVPQRRAWINENLFASCREPSSFNAMAIIVGTLKPVTESDHRRS